MSSDDESVAKRELSKGTLRLTRVISRDPVTVEIDAIDVRLPCRLFRARYKVAQSGRFSLTTEFLLRLLFSVGDLPEDEAGGFFGFEPDETLHAVEAAVSQGYVDRLSSGRLRLSDSGRSAFHSGSEKPHVYEVDEREDNFTLDALSFRPISDERLDDFDSTLPELPVLDIGNIAEPTQAASAAFKRHFRDLNLRRTTDLDNSRDLYTLDGVRPLKRTECVLPISVRLRADGSIVEPDLSHWSAAADHEQRATILSSAVALLHSIEGPNPKSLLEAAGVLAAIAPDITSGIITPAGLHPSRFLKAAASQTGEVQSNRRTVRTVGTLWSVGTLAKLQSAVNFGRRERLVGPRVALWLVPSFGSWGASRRMPAFLRGLLDHGPQEDGSDDPDLRTRVIAMSAPSDRTVERRLVQTADAVLPLRRESVPTGLEVLLLPGRLVAALIHVPVANRGYPIAMGIVSADLQVIARAALQLKVLVDSGKILGVSPDGLELEIEKALMTSSLQIERA